MDRSWDNRRIWRQSRSEVHHHLVLDLDQEPVQIETGLGVSSVENMITLQMSVLI